MSVYKFVTSLKRMGMTENGIKVERYPDWILTSRNSDMKVNIIKKEL